MLGLAGFRNRKDVRAAREEVEDNLADRASVALRDLRQHPAAGNQGVGRRLLSGFFEYVRSQNGKAVMLGVVEDNTNAYHFWLRAGFELVRQTDPRPFGKKMQVVYVMRLKMGAERSTD